MKEQYKPYVVSADANLLLRGWSQENGLSIPKENYFQGMLSEMNSVLSEYFGVTEVIPENVLQQGLQRFLAESKLPVVSLDRTYVRPTDKLLGYLDATRTVDKNLQNTGLGSRAAALSLQRQIGKLAMLANGSPIALLDDVIFEGKTMLDLIQQFRRQGVAVDRVYSGITIQEGQKLLERNGIEVQSVVDPYLQVIDEICERDFRVGVPLSGRTVVSDGQTTGAPYLLPFGKPEQWASIPADKAVEFSLFCLAQSLSLWTRIETESQRDVSPQSLAKPVQGLPNKKSMTQALCASIKQVEQGEV